MNIVAACVQSRHAYNLAHEADVIGVLDDKSKLVLKEVARYYELDHEAKHVDLDMLRDRLLEKYPKHQDIFRIIVAGYEEPVSVPNILFEIQEERKRKIKDELAAAFTQRGNDEWLLNKLDDYRKLCYDETMDDGDTGANLYHNLSVCTVLDGRSGENRITLSPPQLNAAAGGGVLRKHHLLCFARPDAGKSTFAINLTSSFLHQGFKVLYFGNEDPALDITLRMMCRLTSRTEEEIKADTEGTDKVLAERNWDKFIFKEGEPGTARELESLMDEHAPDILIVDQSRNLDMKEDNRVLQLEKAEQFIRNLGKRYDALTISFTQAGGSAEGKLILDMNDVDYSNCLAPETEVRMFDGSSKAIKDIRVGEQVMGLDSTPRTVKAVGGGRQPMYRITHKNGDYYDCNQEHILTLKKTTNSRVFQKYTQGQLVDMPLTTYMARKSYPDHFKGVSVGYQVEGISPFTDPWALGVWLGDGRSSRGEVSNTNLAVIVRLNDIWIDATVRNVLLEQRKACHYIASKRFTSVLIRQDLIENKHIPDCVFKWCLRDRINLLAGLIDADGHNGGYYYELALQGCSERFKQGVKQLCLSIGWYCSISEDDRAYITARHGMFLPCAIPYKQHNAGSKKDVMSSRLTIDPLGEGEYRGITVDGDHRYVLANGIVTHNTGMQASADLMIGIGTNADFTASGQRTVTCVKNKMAGGSKEPFVVNIDYRYNRVY